MRFCKSDEKENPVVEFLDALPSADAQKVIWVLKLADNVEWIPEQYFFQVDNENLWEIRITIDVKNYWLLAFRYNDEWVLCNGDFSTEKKFSLEDDINKARRAEEGYKPSFQLPGQNDLSKYIKKRKKKSSTFTEGFEEGYLHFQIGAILRQARQKAGMTQAEIAEKLEISSSTISRIENHANEVDIATLENYVQSWSKKLQPELTG